jgi:hypothetical protein
MPVNLLTEIDAFELAWEVHVPVDEQWKQRLGWWYWLYWFTVALAWTLVISAAFNVAYAFMWQGTDIAAIHLMYLLMFNRCRRWVSDVEAWKEGK